MSEPVLVEAHSVGLSLARQIIRECQSFADTAGIRVAVVVVDAAGHDVASERMDGAPFAVLPIAREKAWTAAAFGAPTTAWHESSQPGTAFWGLTNALGGRFSVLAGGVPLVLDGLLVGGVGVSGGDATQDHACASAGAAITADAAS